MRCSDSIVFLFKQKMSYKMSISDGSSDVCSSDLPCLNMTERNLSIKSGERRCQGCCRITVHQDDVRLFRVKHFAHTHKNARRQLIESLARTEDLRVGQECVSTCRYRCSPSH